MPSEAEIASRFGPYRKPTKENITKFKKIQEAALKFAHILNDLCPESKQKSTALTQLELCKMSANASIALSQDTSELNVGS